MKTIFGLEWNFIFPKIAILRWIEFSFLVSAHFPHKVLNSTSFSLCCSTVPCKGSNWNRDLTATIATEFSAYFLKHYLVIRHSSLQLMYQFQKKSQNILILRTKIAMDFSVLMRPKIRFILQNSLELFRTLDYNF